MDARGDRPQKDPRALRTSPRGPTSSLTETPLLSAPNVSDCVEVPLQPRFTGERDARQYRVEVKDVLPDGNITTVGAKRFRCADVFASGFCDVSLQTS